MASTSLLFVFGLCLFGIQLSTVQAFEIVVDNSSFMTCRNSTSTPCRPFMNLTFPFASVSGCGHPDFLIDCSASPSPTISIYGFKFRVLALEPAPPKSVFLNFLKIALNDDLLGLNLGMNYLLSSPPPPFLLKDGVRLWDGLLKNLSGACGLSLSGTDIGGFCNFSGMSNLVEGLRKGFQISWEETGERFADCKECRQKSGGVCGFNASDPEKGFLCYVNRTAKRGSSGGLPIAAGITSSSNGTVVTAAAAGKLEGGKSPQNTSISFTDASKYVVIICACVVALVAFSVATSAALHFNKIQMASIAPEELHHISIVPTAPTCQIDKQKHIEIHYQETEDFIPAFSYVELEMATNFFDENLILGDGGYGRVYRGYLSSGCVVAVKRMINQANTLHQFNNEITIMSKLSHPNLLALLGFCKMDHDLLLVYEYVSNGTLADHLHGARKGKHMSLKVRIRVALQVAQALEYMHFHVKPTVIHRDVKSTNILLQADLSTKLADFGLSRDMEGMEGKSHVSTGPQGTPGYIDPEYFKFHRLTQTSDVYSFGVVLMELLTGLKALDYGAADAGEIGLASRVMSMILSGRLFEIVDPMLLDEKTKNAKKVIEEIAELGFSCSAACKDDRPNMKQVCIRLQHIEWWMSSDLI